MKTLEIIIIIPAFNEEKRIGKVLKDIKKTSRLDVIVVDDGSSDNTGVVAKKFGATVLQHKINLGNSKGAAMKTGCEYAFMQGADAVIFMDADGQHKASDLPKFIRALRSKKYDIVFGSRNVGHGMPLVRYLGNKFGSLLVSLMFGIYMSDLLCGYRALTKSAYKKIKWESIDYGVETEMVIRAGKSKLRRLEVQVETVYHDKYKGVTILDAFGVLFNVIRWRLVI